MKFIAALSFLLTIASFADAQDLLLPTPVYAVDFGNPDSVAAANLQDVTAEILTAPEGVDALRIDECGKHAVLPVDVGPSAMPEATLVLALKLESIVDGSLGWALSSDNGGYDRSIILHDYRYSESGSAGVMGIAVGTTFNAWESDAQGIPPLDEWLHISAVFSGTWYDTDPNAEPSFGKLYVNGVPAPNAIEDIFNEEGRTDLVVGTNLYDECVHWVDGWIKEVKVFDKALSAEKVAGLSQEFFDNMGTDSVFKPNNAADADADASTSSSSSDEEESSGDGSLLDTILGSSGGIGGNSEEEESSSSSSSSSDSGLLSNIIDAVLGDDDSSAPLVNIHGMTMAILLVGSLLGFVM